MLLQMLDTLQKQVLVDVVKKVQKEGLKGINGSWKEFLDVYDKKLGSSLSDPNKRSNGDLIAFLNTITNKDNLKFLEKVVQCHLNCGIMEESMEKSEDNETAGPGQVYEHAQRLVRITLEHPQYPVQYSLPSYDEGWVVMKLEKNSKVIRTPEIVAVDCEMVLCEDGTEALVKVCVVDHNLKVKLDKLVKPNKVIVDYRTDITGITAEHMEGDIGSLEDVQEIMKNILSPGTVLIGHSLNNDLKALKIDYARVIDTSFVFKYSGGPSHKRPSLSNLCKAVLDYEVREKGKPHNCLDDAKAAMELVLARIKQGVDIPIDLVEEDVPSIEVSKLLIHRIPISVDNTELHNIIPGNFEIERKPLKKDKAENHLALAKFENPQQARQAFESIKGTLEKDTSGRPQKLVTFQLSSGFVGALYVRKMVSDDAQVASKKRLLQADNSAKTKKPKADDGIKEIKESDESLKPESEHMKVIEEQAQQIESMKDELRRKDNKKNFIDETSKSFQGGNQSRPNTSTKRRNTKGKRKKDRRQKTSRR